MLHRYLILGLLMDGPLSGYDIKKQMSSVLGLITNASYGTLYPMLHKLLAEQAVNMQEILQTGRPSKKVYRLTDQGQQEFLDWLKRPAAADQGRREFLLKLYLARNLEPAHLLALVTARRQEVQLTQQRLSGDQNTAQTPQERWVVDYTLALCNAEVEWLKQVETHVHQAESVYQPPEAIQEI
jgi:DNA-binding PadR family transcriptional regulator